MPGSIENMVTALLLSFGVIFVAELGDKSQLMAMTFALRYRWPVVVAGIFAATAVTHTLSVTIGHYLGAALPTGLIAVVTGVAFVLVGLWSLREDDAVSAGGPRRTAVSAFFAVASAFLLAELGDKTMFATVTLAADHNWLGVWIGSTLGMVTADGLAIAVGILAGRHLPERHVRLVAAFGFLYAGSWTLLAALLPTAPAVALLAASAVVPLLVGTAWWWRTGRQARTRLATAAQGGVPTPAP